MELLSEADLTRRATFPENVDIRGIAAHLAARVFEQAVEENLKISNKVRMVGTVFVVSIVTMLMQVMLEAYDKGGMEGLKQYIYSKMWYPHYRPLVYQQPGKGE